MQKIDDIIRERLNEYTDYKNLFLDYEYDQLKKFIDKQCAYRDLSYIVQTKVTYYLFNQPKGKKCKHCTSKH